MGSGFKSGFITIVGAPNVGKSTLLNALVGEKVSIVTPKPQTTRNRILGIKNLPQAQLIFVDTPGIHETQKRFNKIMVDTARAALKESDIVVVMAEATQPEPRDEFRYLARLLKGINATAFFALNKIDLVEKTALLALIERYATSGSFREIVPISARTGSGVTLLEKCLIHCLPEGPQYFPETMYTDQSERFIVAEIIREKAFLLLHKEIPYSVAVAVSEFKERKDGMIFISASIWVEKHSQKGIVVGKGGGMLRTIGSRAREEIERILNAKVYLDLWVTVKKNWTQQDGAIKESLRH